MRPRGRDPPYDESNPELPEDLEEDQGAEAIEGDGCRRVFGFRAEPSPL